MPVVTLHGLLQWLVGRSHWSERDLVAWLEAEIAPLRLIDTSGIDVMLWTAMKRLVALCADQPEVQRNRHPVDAVRSLIRSYHLRVQALG